MKLQIVRFPGLRLANPMDSRGYRDRCLHLPRSTCGMRPPDDILNMRVVLHIVKLLMTHIDIQLLLSDVCDVVRRP